MTSPLPSSKRLVVALIGRPNVGKSTLFNRLMGSRKAVVSPIRGTTRDRVYGQTRWRGTALTLIDTGGFELGDGRGISALVQRHLRAAVEEADTVVLVCDAQQGLVPADEMLLEQLRPLGKPVVLAANKADHQLLVPPDFFRLGLDETFAVSALHGRGTGELLDHLAGSREGAAVSGREEPVQPQVSCALAIIGRQNVGKSSLVNALLREERVIVSDQPGTTRDAIDTELVVRGTSVTLIDTAGLRHRRKVKDPVDLFAMSRTIGAIARCDVALVVLDATLGVTSDDRRIIAQVIRAGRGLVLLANKWDLVKRGREAELTPAVRRAAPLASFAPVLAISAKTGWHVGQALDLALGIVRRMREGIPEAAGATAIREAWSARPAPRDRGRLTQLRRIRWAPGRPVRLELVVGPSGWLPLPFQRFLLRHLRADPRWAGVPIRLVIRSPRNADGPPT